MPGTQASEELSTGDPVGKSREEGYPLSEQAGAATRGRDNTLRLEVLPRLPSGHLTGFDTRSYIEPIRRDAPFHGFVAAYGLVGLLVGTVAGVPHKFVPLSYLGILARSLPELLLLVVAGAGIWSLRSPTPFAALRGTLRGVFRPHTVAGLLLFASVSIHMGVFTSVKTMLTDMVPFSADPLLADLDRLLHGRDPWLYGSALLPPQITVALEPIYFGAWGVILPASLIAVLLLPKLAEVRTHYVWALLLSWPLLGNGVAAALMSAGPVYYELVTGDARFAGLVEYLAQHSMVQPQAQEFLWKSHVFGQAGVGSGISAFPSIHLASATLFVLLASRINRRLMWLALAFCVVILFGSVHLGWHYAVDGYFSIAAMIFLWKTIGRILERQQRSQAGLA